MFYFEKDHPNILYVDRRRETVEMKDRDKIRTLEINPDFVMDFTDMKFPDECFYFVVSIRLTSSTAARIAGWLKSMASLIKILGVKH